MCLLKFKWIVIYCFTATHIVSPFTFSGISTRNSDPEVVENLELSLVLHNGIKKINGTYAQRTVFQFVEADLTIDLEQARNKRTRFLDTKLDLCNFFNGKYENNQLLRHIRKCLTKSKTFRQKCPLPAHHMFKLDMLDLGALYTGYLPNVSFLATLRMHQEGHLYVQINLNGFSRMK